jgi:hypothetical protein
MLAKFSIILSDDSLSPDANVLMVPDIVIAFFSPPSYLFNDRSIEFGGEKGEHSLILFSRLPKIPASTDEHHSAVKSTDDKKKPNPIEGIISIASNHGDAKKRENNQKLSNPLSSC